MNIGMWSSQFSLYEDVYNAKVITDDLIIMHVGFILSSY